MKSPLKICAILQLLSASAAAADVGAGLRAFETGDYETAQRLLSEEDARFDAKALQARGRMALEGLGRAPDYDEAYWLLSLAAQFGTGSDGSEALSARAKAGQKLDPDRIRAAEGHVVELVNEHFGSEAVEREVRKLIQQLDSCEKGCDEIALRLFDYGPAAAEAIPALEEVITRDPYWLPRRAYSSALMLIGTPAVPSLCRITADRTELLYEGPYNIEIALQALGQLGPSVRPALSCVMDVLERRYPRMPLRPPYPEPGDYAALLNEVKKFALIALDEIGDPDRILADRLGTWVDAESDLLLRQIAAGVICGIHEDYGPAAKVAAEVLPGPASLNRDWMVLILDSACGDLPGLTTALAPFREQLLQLSQEDSEAGAAALIARFPDQTGSGLPGP